MKTMQWVKGISLVAILCVAAQAQAATISDSTIGLQATVPDTWVMGEEDGAVLAVDPSEEAAVFLVVVPLAEIDDEEDISDFLDEVFDAYELEDEQEETEINGLPAAVAAGEGILEGEEVVWGVAVVLHNEHVLFLLAVADAENYEAYEAQLFGILNSISPL